MSQSLLSYLRIDTLSPSAPTFLPFVKPAATYPYNLQLTPWVKDNSFAVSIDGYLYTRENTELEMLPMNLPSGYLLAPFHPITTSPAKDPSAHIAPQRW